MQNEDNDILVQVLETQLHCRDITIKNLHRTIEQQSQRYKEKHKQFTTSIIILSAILGISILANIILLL